MLLEANATSTHKCPTTILSHGALIGDGLTAGASVLSGSAILIVVFLVMRRVYLRRTAAGAMLRPAIKTHVDFYMVSLLLSDFLQACGGVLNFYHVHLGRTECSPICTAQGALKSLGEPSAAMATLAITVHTFCVIFFHWAPPANFLIPCVVFGFIWIYCGAYVAISWVLHHSKGLEYFQPVPYWCWVSALYPAQRLSAEYCWLWVSALGSILLYIPLFLFIRGNLEVDPVKPWRMTFRKTTAQRQAHALNRNRQSLKMLLYPIVYLIIVLPLSAVRYIGFIQGNAAVPMAGTFVGIVPFHLAGLLNVLLLIFTRPSILVFGGAFDTRTGMTSQGTSQNPGAVRFNTSQGVEVSVHVQHDVYAAYDYDDDLSGPKVARLDFSPRMGNKRMDSNDDLKQNIQLSDMQASLPRPPRAQQPMSPRAQPMSPRKF